MVQVCLELLIAVALRNRDRIVLIWPLVHEYLNAIMTPNGAKAATPLVARVGAPSQPCPLCMQSMKSLCYQPLLLPGWVLLSNMPPVYAKHEKAMLPGVMTGASVPQSSPRSSPVHATLYQ